MCGRYSSVFLMQRNRITKEEKNKDSMHQNTNSIKYLTVTKIDFDTISHTIS
jgi:hypothetical protein